MVLVNIIAQCSFFVVKRVPAAAVILSLRGAHG